MEITNKKKKKIFNKILDLYLKYSKYALNKTTTSFAAFLISAD